MSRRDREDNSKIEWIQKNERLTQSENSYEIDMIAEKEKHKHYNFELIQKISNFERLKRI